VGAIAEWIRGVLGKRRGSRGGILGKGGVAMDNEKWRILVIDDDPDVLDLIQMKLGEEYDVLCIESPTDVSQAADLFEPDLIILDIMLPKISGYQVIEYLKRNPKTAQVPVCFLSAKSSARDLKYGYKLGAALYLTKPFQPERLVRNIKLLFERTPPPRTRKTFSIEQINERLNLSGAYKIATASPETLAREAAKREKRPKPPEPSTPPTVPDEGEEPHQRARWLD